MNERVEIPGALAGERVDRAVAMLSGRSRAEVAELIAAGRIRLSGQAVAVRHRRVEVGEVLEFDTDTEALAANALAPAPEVVFEVVYEDDSIVVIDKPAGLVVHPGAAHRDDTLASGLLHRFPDLVAASAEGAWEADRPGIVHRLDKDTSGLLVVARTPSAYRSLVAQLAERSMSRRYLTLALGRVEADEGVIEAPIGRSRRDPTRMTVIVGGREARTRYSVERRFEAPIACSLLRCALDTGRTHQIRVHLRAIGHPVAGDARYGGRAPALLLQRPFLHAAQLELTHPESGERLSFEAPLPMDLTVVLDALEAQDAGS